MNGLHRPLGRIGRARVAFEAVFGRRGRRLAVALLVVASAVPACSVLPQVPGAWLPDAAFEADFLLIGEVHDNAAQHRLRLGWLEALAARRRFAIALEPFDAVRQQALDRARAADAAAAQNGEPPAQRARRIAEAAGFDFRGWNWDDYRPVVELALRLDLPLAAANLSRVQTVAIARGAAPAAPLPEGWDADEQRALEASIRDGHCGLLPESAIAPMAAAQRSRDAQMARAIVEVHRRSGLPVALLAGNGHQRRDIGVPRYLAKLAPGERVFSIGLLEEEGAAGAADGPEAVQRFAARYDFVVATPAARRDDPCDGLRAKTRHRPAAAPR